MVAGRVRLLPTTDQSAAFLKWSHLPPHEPRPAFRILTPSKVISSGFTFGGKCASPIAKTADTRR